VYVLISYQVELTGGPFQPYLIVCVLIRYKVDLTGGPDQVYLSDLPDSEWLTFAVTVPCNFSPAIHRGGGL
jgi:hypothetical protein